MLLSMTVENQVMRLPRYARGLKLARLGMFLMLLHFALTAYLVTLLIRASPGDEDHLFSVMKLTLYANLGAVGVMLVGALISVPDFLAAKLPLWRLVVSVIGFGIALAALAWSTKVLFTFTNLASDPDATYAQVTSALDDLMLLRFMTIVRDIGYGLGIVAMLRSIRQTAQANEHYPLRDAADTVTNLTAGLVVLDILYQWMFGGAGNSMLGLYGVILGIIGGLVLVAFWVYCHLRLAKFLKAAAILVHEAHHLPIARVVVIKPEVKPDESAPQPVASRHSGPIAKLPVAKLPVAKLPVAKLDERASQPLTVVAAELRPAHIPRAETAPGAPPDEPKLLR